MVQSDNGTWVNFPKWTRAEKKSLTLITTDVLPLICTESFSKAAGKKTKKKKNRNSHQIRFISTSAAGQERFCWDIIFSFLWLQNMTEFNGVLDISCFNPAWRMNLIQYQTNISEQIGSRMIWFPPQRLEPHTVVFSSKWPLISRRKEITCSASCLTDGAFHSSKHLFLHVSGQKYQILQEGTVNAGSVWLQSVNVALAVYVRTKIIHRRFGTFSGELTYKIKYLK